MEVAYTVGVSNRFASLMTEDDDPGDQLISGPGAPEKDVKPERQRKDVKTGKQKDNREKEQQTRKGAQDAAKRTCTRIPTIF